MLTIEQINNNKEEFLTLIRSIKRDGMDTDKLVKKLEKSDFFTAPASTKYHCAYEGGLCEHSLNVYYNLVNLCNQQGLDEECYDENALKIVALLHDISKMNIYEPTARNEKVYCKDGDKYDSLGNYKWVTSLGYKTKENKFVFGSHEMTSEYIARQFVPLTVAESVAILHHMGGMHYDSAQDNLGEVFNQYHLALMLHIADMMSTYVTERE